MGSEICIRGNTGTQEEFDEELGAVDLLLTAEGCEDPALKGLPQAVTVFASHYEEVGEVPTHAILLASPPDRPVQMLRVGRNVYACRFSPGLDAAQFKRRVSIYDEAGYGNPDMSEDILTRAWSSKAHGAGQIIRNFVSHLSRS